MGSLGPISMAGHEEENMKAVAPNSHDQKELDAGALFVLKSKGVANLDEKAMLHGSADIAKRLFSFAESMTLKCAVELRIADIIHSHGHPITLSEIASSIDSPSTNVSYLHRIMRMLVRMKIFTITQSDGGDIRYGLTPSSMVLLHDAEISLAPLVLMQNHPIFLSAWHYLSDCVREGGSGIKKAHGRELFEMNSISHELNNHFNDAMRCSTMIFTKEIISIYRDGFNAIQTLVDVGGGIGHMIAEIVKEFPHVKGTNFDLPHVVATAPAYNGVSHVAGDMFKVIPTADAIFMMSILHDWGDENCVKILKNCRKALANNTGKVIIVDVVLREDAEPDQELFGNLDLISDLSMMAHCPDGKERAEKEWKKILEEGGFPNYKITKLPSFASLIEAYPA